MTPFFFCNFYIPVSMIGEGDEAIEEDRKWISIGRA
jgi:hypothetical protein